MDLELELPDRAARDTSDLHFVSRLPAELANASLARNREP